MILKQPSLWGTALGLFSSNYTFYFMLNWLPAYLQAERGFSLIAMTQLATLAFAVNAASAFLAGWAIDKYLRRGGSANFGYKSVMAVAHVGSVVCMLAMAVGSLKVALISVFVFQALCGASSPGVYAMCQILAGPRASGRWVGIQNSLGNLPGIIAPWLTGYIVIEHRPFHQSPSWWPPREHARRDRLDRDGAEARGAQVEDRGAAERRAGLVETASQPG